MNARRISLTLAAMAVLSNTAAFADEVVVNQVGSVVNTTTETRILTNAAIVAGSVRIRGAAAVSANDEAPGHVFDLGLFGFGIHAGRVPKHLDMR